MEPINTTPFLIDAAVFLDKTGAEHFIVALKATYRIAPDGALAIAEEQFPLQAADVLSHPDEPEKSSIAHEAEMGPPKLATDIFLQGHACAPHANANTVEVRFCFGHLEKRAVIMGDRVWLRQMNIARISTPLPFEKIALTYENGYGGVDVSPEDEKHHGYEARNPVGQGFRAKQSRRVWDNERLPNIEEIGHCISHPEQRINPVGFGPIGRNWQPRVRYAGTYDQQWMQERMPLLPHDFDDRFHNAAPPDLIFPGFVTGGEAVAVHGCTHDKPLGFRLPAVRPQARIRLCSGDVFPEMPCQSVTVDMDRMELRLLWKGCLNVHRKLLRIQAFECRLNGDRDIGQTA
jgi:hypothetical protein